MCGCCGPAANNVALACCKRMRGGRPRKASEDAAHTWARDVTVLRPPRPVATLEPEAMLRPSTSLQQQQGRGSMDGFWGACYAC